MKKIIKIALLFLVAGSVGFLVYKETRGQRVGVENSNMVSSNATSNINEKDNNRTQSADAVIAYYFHGTNRCHTCNVIEGYIYETLSSHFSNEIKKGKILWQVTNVQTPETQHFIRDFQLTSISMVLAKKVNGEVKTWKNLDKIWQLVRDKTIFMEYIKSEVSAFLKES